MRRVVPLLMVCYLPVVPGIQSLVFATDTALSVPGLRFGPTRTIEHGTNPVSGPALQVDAKGNVHVAWVESEQGQHNVYHVKVPPESGAPLKSVRVNPPEETVATAVMQPPGLAVGSDRDIYLTYAAPHPQGNRKPLMMILRFTRSEDGGRTFAPPITIHDDPSVSEHNFEQVTVGTDGVLHFVWLDSRDRKSPLTTATFAARSTDGGRTIGKNVKVDDDACVCCRAALVAAQDGTVYLAWRKALPGDIREMVVARSTDGGRTYSSPVIVGHDRWVYAGCPHRPASMALDGLDRIYVAWYSEGPDETPANYVAYSDDGGETFSPRLMLNRSKGTFPDHPQIAVDRQGRVVAIWEEMSPVRREIMMSYSLDRGRTFSPPLKVNEKRGEKPAVVMLADGQAAIAWIEPTVFPNRGTILRTLQLPKSSQ
ncbi:MAG: sialidase family protein [Nitrospiraceae bacterium]